MEYWKAPSVAASWLWVGMCLVLLLLFLIIWIARHHISYVKKESIKQRLILTQTNHKLLVTSIIAQEKERKRIATNLHDNLISQLNIIRLSDPTVLSNKNLNKKIRNCMEIIRNICHDLHPPFLQHMTLYEIIKDHCDALPNDYIVHCYFNEDKVRFTPFEKLQLLRITQEVTNNIFKHAKASKIQIDGRATNTSLLLRIKDNGIGIKQESKKGLGLQSIHSRAKLLNASYKLYSRNKLGTTFLLYMKTK